MNILRTQVALSPELLVLFYSAFIIPAAKSKRAEVRPGDCS